MTMKAIPTLFISKKEFAFKSFAEEVEDVLYGELPDKMEFETIEEAQAYQETLDSSKYSSYIGNVYRNYYSG